MPEASGSAPGMPFVVESEFPGGAVPALPYGAPVVPGAAAVPPVLRTPHGTRMWRLGDDGELLVAVYDAIGGVWTPVRADLASTFGAD